MDDGSDIAALMNCFTKKEVKSRKFPVLSKEVTKLKSTEGGAGAVCKVMQEYERIARQEGRQEGILNTLVGLVRDGLLSAKDAAERLQISEAEVKSLAAASLN